MVFCYLVVFTLCGLISTANGQSGQGCVVPNYENLQCVEINTCSILYRLVTVLQIQDVRILNEFKCNYSNAPPVCCDIADRFGTDTPTITTRPNVSETFKRNPLLPDRSSCGFQDGFKIAQSIYTDLLEFPWMALLHYRTTGGGFSFSCGGVLINERYVLTAAHCVVGAITQNVGTLIGVRLGEYDTTTAIDCIPPQSTIDCNRPFVDVAVEGVLVHQDYDDNSRSRYHDIALIRLAVNVELNEQVKLICLPTSSTERSEPGTPAYAAGWGHTETIDYDRPKKLKVELPVVSNRDCADIFSNVQVKVADTQICAGGQVNRNSCNGDQGGPLMVTAQNDSGQWIAEGVASFDTTCGPKYWPGVYTRVSEYLPWIHENVRA